jgi:2Fe-2S ferredoxin
MVKITYIEFNGREHVADVPVGYSVMEGAKKNGIPGIDADCGGACQCGTCHVYVDAAWQKRLSQRTDIETPTMAFSENVEPNSRLSCQIKVTADLDGLIVRMPRSQR